jgi:outer membrane protein assembly factor BamB
VNRAGRWLRAVAFAATAVLAACSPAAIPLNGDLPEAERATLREVENLGGWVEITRVDQKPTPDGSAYWVSAGKHKVELVRHSPTTDGSAETYFVKGGQVYVTWDGCVREMDPKTGEEKVEIDQKTGEEKAKLRCEPPQLLPEDALPCYQQNERTKGECKALTDSWSESSGNE